MKRETITIAVNKVTEINSIKNELFILQQAKNLGLKLFSYDENNNSRCLYNSHDSQTSILLSLHNELIKEELGDLIEKLIRKYDKHIEKLEKELENIKD